MLTAAGFTRCATEDSKDVERHRAARYELRFTELFNARRGYAFPCDAQGHVDIDTLTDLARANYFYARTTIGRLFCSPVTRAVLE